MSDNTPVAAWQPTINPWLMITPVMLAIFMGVLSATMNAFSGFVTYYLIEFTKTLNPPQKNSFDEYDMRNYK